MSDVFMCDCCEEVLPDRERNKILELVDDIWGEESTAKDDVCDACLEDIFDQMGYEEIIHDFYEGSGSGNYEAEDVEAVFEGCIQSVSGTCTGQCQRGMGM